MSALHVHKHGQRQTSCSELQTPWQYTLLAHFRFSYPTKHPMHTGVNELMCFDKVGHTLTLTRYFHG